MEVEVGIEKYAMLLMKGGEQNLTDGMVLPNQDNNARRKGNVRILEHLGR